MYNGCREVDEHAQIQFVGRMDRRNHACGSGVSRRKTTQNNKRRIENVAFDYVESLRRDLRHYVG